MEQPLVSVLMTAYNRQKYIGEAIESVMASTYQNWELIIVDDCSKDNTVEIAKSYEAKDSRIKVYLNEKNLGDYPNRNQAASYAKGKYLKYVDADDLIYTNCLEYMVGSMEKHPDASYGLYTLQQHNTKPFPYLLTPKQSYYEYYINKRDYFERAPLSSIIKKEAFGAVNGFSGKQHLGDFELWNLLSQEFNLLVLSHSHGYVWYRKHDDQQMNDNITDPFVPFKYLLLSIDLLKETKCPLDSNSIELALTNQKKRIVRSILSAAKHHSLKKANQLRKAANLTYWQLFTGSIKLINLTL